MAVSTPARADSLATEAAPAAAGRSRFMEEVRRRVLVYDGAMGVSLQAQELPPEAFGGREGPYEILVLTRPDVVEQLHASFFDVGADVVETDTFQGSRLKLAEWGLADQTYEINYAAADLARRVADRFSTRDRPRFVAGSIGPTGMLPSSTDPILSAITFDELVEVGREQARALIDGGVDVIIIETQQDILETRAMILGARKAMAEIGRWVPIQAQATFPGTDGRMLLGTEISAVLATLEALPIDVIGINCSTGPDYMRDQVRYLGEHARLPVSCIPNMGLALNIGGRAVYPLEPEPLARDLEEFVTKYGVNIVGGCCGSTPAHIKLLVERLGGRPPAPREPNGEPRVSSAMRAVSLRQDPPPLLVGERVNAQGSRMVKRFLLKDDYDSIVRIARDQVEGGAHVLDVQTAVTERPDEADQMAKLVKLLSMSVEAPLVIDTTEAAVAEAALKVYPGRAIVNAINMENGRGRIDATLPLVKQHGAAVIALTIDEDGMAKTAARKLEVARRIYDIAVNEYGLSPGSLLFDTLTFVITTGEPEMRSSAIESIEGIRRIKTELPGALTILGVSNLSFGVSVHARAVLNSVFLYHAVQAGLDAAIVNPAHVRPYAEIPVQERELGEDLILNRREDALARLIAHFEDYTPAEAAATEDPTEGMTSEQKLHYQILHRKKEGVEALIDDSLQKRMAPGTAQGPAAVDVLNNVLLPAMKEVGDKFGAGELILPFVLQSAEVMKKSVGHLEQYLDKQEGVSKGKVVLATVYGDVHDIGKNLVNTILSNNGYTVYDLGKQVPISVILDRAVEVNADAIGLSALLVSTSKQMPLCAQELDRRGLRLPLIVGGAAINRHYVRRINWLDEEKTRLYEPGVFYARDAFEGLDVMDQLVEPARRQRLVERLRDDVLEAVQKESRGLTVPLSSGAGEGVAQREVRRSPAAKDARVPTPPFWGYRILQGPGQLPFDGVYACLDTNALFRSYWGAPLHGKEFSRAVAEELGPRLEEYKRLAIEEGWLTPRVIYAYVPVQASGDDLIVYDPEAWAERGRKVERERFYFPRQATNDRLSMADYFAPVDSGQMDVAALQVVTAGDAASEWVERLQRAGEYSRSYYIHGFAAACAEALAEWTNRLARRDLGLEGQRGKRYSWGYPACPDLEEQVKLFRLFPVTATIGVELTASYQFQPDQSTAAIVVHHPQAKYFSVENRRAAKEAAAVR